ncbi:MAG TPA: aminotransferase class V-fold PLP-dependent enzyme [Tepidisphaeraceae bacterium]|nr:aminotransferase class V-fold PLP-dependent enzyme [Tepidisphaeraceae bacterium]
MDLIYLDNNATTQPAPEVAAAMWPFLTEQYGNPSSIHRLGQQSRAAVDEARTQVARLVGSSPNEIYFTGGGTEAINTAIVGLLKNRRPRRRIVTSSVEHSATRELCQALSKEGAEIVEIPVDRQGSLDLAVLEQSLNEQTALAAFMWANNETGVIFPIQRISQLCKAKQIPLHCDATQAVGKFPVEVKQIGADAMSFAAHKFHGPKGVGALYARRGLRLPALIVGGPQEVGRRGGTENVPGIVGMGVAAELAAARLGEMSRVAELRDRFEHTVLAQIKDTRVLGRTDARLPNTTNIAFARLEAEAILLLLSERGICASAGAACSSGSLEPSHVLLSMGIEPAVAHGAVRFSLSRFTTPDEIDKALEILPAVIERLRQVLPVG